MTEPQQNDIQPSQTPGQDLTLPEQTPGDHLVKTTPFILARRQAHMLILKVQVIFLRLKASFLEKYFPDLPTEIESDFGLQPDGGVKRATHFFFILLTVFCLGFGFWAYFGRLDVMSMAQGEVVPSTQIKQIQHLEGGIVRRILVQEGQLVTKGQPLVEMQTTASEADVRELKLRLTALQIEILRLEAEAAGSKQIEFSPELLANHPHLVQQAQSLFQTRTQRLQNDLNRQQELITQRRQELNEINVRVQNQKKRLVLLEEQITISEDLLKDDLTNRYEHLNLLKEQNTLKSAIGENLAAYQRAQAALKEETVRLKSIRNAFDEEVQTHLESSRQRYREFTERMRKYADSLQRTVLRAPVDGVVKTLYVFTEGGVVRPGGTLLDIVPRDDVLVVEAKLPTQDIGYIHTGQKAVLQLLSSADARRFGKLKGKVIHISPDTMISNRGSPYYKVRVATEKAYFEHKNSRYKLYPGMLLSVSILTGKRTVFEYLVSPWVTSLDSAMTER